MKLSELEARITADKVVKPETANLPEECRVIPNSKRTCYLGTKNCCMLHSARKSNTALAGEISKEASAEDSKKTEVLDEFEQFEDDMEYAVWLLKQVKDLFYYLSDSKLKTTIEPIDRKEMINQIAQIDVFLECLDESDDTPKEAEKVAPKLDLILAECIKNPELLSNGKKTVPNLGKCKHFMYSSCIDSTDQEKWCSSCKVWWAQSSLDNMIEFGDDLTQNDVDRLNSMNQMTDI